jgi:hypothetical protein
MVPNSNGHQRRLPSNQHSKLSNSRRPRRDPRSLPGRWRWCDRPWLCDAQKASALHTLIRQRHPTPSCGGHAPTAERTMIPARMCLESLDRRPGIREQPGSNSDPGPRPSQVRSTLNSGNRQTARACPYRIVSLGRVISNLVWHQQAQRCIVSNALLAKEGHCIDLGTGIVVGAKKSDMLDAGGHRSPGRGMFLTGYFTLPISGGAFIASCKRLLRLCRRQRLRGPFQELFRLFDRVGHSRHRHQ